MANAKRRSVFWVVTTHVLTTGFVMPLLATVLGLIVIPSLELSETGRMLLILGFQAAGYVGGVFHSMGYLRKAAIIERPRACIRPSILIYALLVLLGVWLHVIVYFGPGASEVPLASRIIALALFYLIIFSAFVLVTQRGFTKLERSIVEEFG